MEIYNLKSHLIILRIILVIILSFCLLETFSQSNTDTIKTRPLSSFNLNILGDASLFSVNYELLFLTRTNIIIGTKIGLGYNEEFKICVWENCSAPKKYFTIPHSFTVNYGKKKHFLEMGVGGTVIVGSSSQNYMPYAILAYRFLPLKSNKLKFRVFGEYPFANPDNYDIIFIPFGVSIGISL